MPSGLAFRAGAMSHHPLDAYLLTGQIEAAAKLRFPALSSLSTLCQDLLLFGAQTPLLQGTWWRPGLAVSVHYRTALKTLPHLQLSSLLEGTRVESRGFTILFLSLWKLMSSSERESQAPWAFPVPPLGCLLGNQLTCGLCQPSSSHLALSSPPDLCVYTISFPCYLYSSRPFPAHPLEPS